jgi:PKD repeat protein
LDPDGTILSYAWNFGDGTSGTGATVSHAYANPGIYIATLTVTDNSGGTDSDTAMVSITNAPQNQVPVVNAGPGKTGMAGIPVYFSGSVSDPDGTVGASTWTFGDGGTAVGTNASHTYTNAGTFTATFTAVDNLGASASSSVVVTVSSAAASGQTISAMKLGGQVNDSGKAIAVDRYGNVIIGGTADYRPFLAKRTPAGVVAWLIEPPGSGGGEITSVAVDGAGDILVTGNFMNTLDFGGGPLVSAGLSWDIFVAKYSSSGAHLWSKRFGSPTVTGQTTDTGYGIAVDTNDNSVVVTGVYDTSVDFGGGLLNGVSSLNLFLVKLRADGSHTWSKRVAGGNGAAGRAVAVDRNGNVFLTGEFYSPGNFGSGVVTNYAGSNPDMFVAKYSPGGSNLWVKHFGRVATQCRGYSVAVDSADDVICAGITTDTNSFGGAILGGQGMEDIVLVKFSGLDGTHRWSKSFGSIYYDLPFGVAVDGAGRISITGAVRKPMAVTAGPESSGPGWNQATQLQPLLMAEFS